MINALLVVAVVVAVCLGFWSGLALVGLGIADITGIPSIVEGYVGGRAFNNGHPLTRQDLTCEPGPTAPGT